MKYKEAIKKIPADSDVSIGCRKGAGWFYFTKSDNLKAETEFIFHIMDNKLKKSLNQIRGNIPTLESQMKSEKYMKFVSCKGFIRDWCKLEAMKKKLPKMWMEYSEFNIIELLNCECVVLHKVDGSYGILLKKWNVSGNYWTREEWERDNGEI